MIWCWQQQQTQEDHKFRPKTTVNFGKLCRLAEILMTEKLDVWVNMQPRQRPEEIPMKSCIISDEVLQLVCLCLLTVRLFRGLFQSWASGSFLPLPMLYQSLSKVFPLSKPEPEHNWSNNLHRLNCFQRCQEWGAPEELLTALIRLSGCLSLLSHFYQCQTKTRQKRKIRKLKHELFVVVFWRRSHRKSYD